MKKLYITLIAICSVLCTGCEDFLTTDNKSNVTDEKYFSTKSGFESLVSNAYETLRTIFADSSFPTFFNAGTDMYADGRMYINDELHEYETLNPENSVMEEFYTACYDGIRAAYAVAYYAPRAAVDEALRLKRVDEARVVAAYYYYLLANTFGGVPLIKEYVSAAQTGYLKAHYPAEFMAANLSNNLSDITKVTVFMDECKRMGLSVLAPDVNESYNDFTVNTHGQIRFGMAAIKGVGEAAVETIIKEREKNGAYKNVYDFFERIDYRAVNKKTLENLITAGGLDSFGYHRAQYLRELNPGSSSSATVLDTLINYGQKKQQDAMSMQASLFGDLEGFDVVKPPIADCEPWHDYEKSKKEKDLIGIYLTSHPLDPYKLEMQFLCTPLEELNNGLEPFKNREITIAGIVTSKREGKTKNGKDFGILTLEDFSGTHELAFFGKDYANFHQYLTNGAKRMSWHSTSRTWAYWTPLLKTPSVPSRCRSISPASPRKSSRKCPIFSSPTKEANRQKPKAMPPNSPKTPRRTLTTQRKNKKKSRFISHFTTIRATTSTCSPGHAKP